MRLEHLLSGDGEKEDELFPFLVWLHVVSEKESEMISQPDGGYASPLAQLVRAPH